MSEQAPPIDVLSLTSADFIREAGIAAPATAGLAGAIYCRVFETGRLDPETAGASPANAAAWLARFTVGLLPIASRAEEEGEAGRTVKFAFRLEDGEEIESVAVPMFGGTHSLCVSSQVGCARACAFCETGRAGLVRNLEPREIVSQVLSASLALSIRFRNIVFMGMGEPLDNLENVVRSIAILRDQRGMCYSLERISVCTSGNADGIIRLGSYGLSRLNLSLSLNAARGELRDSLMPINRTFPLVLLSAALASYPKRKNFVLAVNYCLIPDRNDSEADAEAVHSFVAGLGRVLVNVIPYNPGRAPIGRAPTDEEIDRFIDSLRSRGIPVRRRAEKGRSLMAACGQLGGLKA